MRLFGLVDASVDKYDRPFFFGEIFTRRWHDEFPALSIGASFQNFTEDSAVDPTIRSEFENGVVLSRARFTQLKKKFSVGYNFLTAADKLALVNLQTSIMIGAKTFYWTNSDDSVEYRVRLTIPMKFQIEQRNFDYWNVRLEMAEQ